MQPNGYSPSTSNDGRAEQGVEVSCDALLVQGMDWKDSEG